MQILWSLFSSCLHCGHFPPLTLYNHDSEWGGKQVFRYHILYHSAICKIRPCVRGKWAGSRYRILMYVSSLTEGQTREHPETSPVNSPLLIAFCHNSPRIVHKKTDKLYFSVQMLLRILLEMCARPNPVNSSAYPKAENVQALYTKWSSLCRYPPQALCTRHTPFGLPVHPDTM